MSNAVTFDALSPSSIENAIKQIQNYRQSLNEKATRLAQRIAEEVAWSASAGFSTAPADDIIGQSGFASGDVTVTVESDGAIQIVMASGPDAVFLEFGAGVYYNGAAGSSPHPKGAELGFLIGEYGQGYGRRNVWAFPGEGGEMVLTHGTPASMPMYHGLENVLTIITDLAREVFAA